MVWNKPSTWFKPKPPTPTPAPTPSSNGGTAAQMAAATNAQIGKPITTTPVSSGSTNKVYTGGSNGLVVRSGGGGGTAIQMAQATNTAINSNSASTGTINLQQPMMQGSSLQPGTTSISSSPTIGFLAATGGFFSDIGTNIKTFATPGGGSYVNPLVNFGYTTNIQASKQVNNPMFHGYSGTINPQDFTQQPFTTKGGLQTYYNSNPTISQDLDGNSIMTTKVVGGNLGERQFYENVAVTKNIAIGTTAAFVPEVGVAMMGYDLYKNAGILTSKTSTSGEKWGAGAFAVVDVATIGLFSKASWQGWKNRAITEYQNDLLTGIKNKPFKGEYSIVGDVQKVEYSRSMKIGSDSLTESGMQISKTTGKNIASFGLNANKMKVNTYMFGEVTVGSTGYNLGKYSIIPEGKSGYTPIMGGSVNVPVTNFKIESGTGFFGKQYSNVMINTQTKPVLTIKPVGGKSKLYNENIVHGYSGNVNKIFAKQVTFGKGLASDIDVNMMGARINNPSEFFLKAKKPQTTPPFNPEESLPKINQGRNLGGSSMENLPTTNAGQIITETKTFQAPIMISKLETAKGVIPTVKGGLTTQLFNYKTMEKTQTMSMPQTQSLTETFIETKSKNAFAVPVLQTMTGLTTQTGTKSGLGLVTAQAQPQAQTSTKLFTTPITTGGWGGGFDFSNNFKIPINPFKFNAPSLDFGGIGGKTKSKKRRSKYTPSLSALPGISNFFGKKTKKGKQPKGTETGLKTRPFTKGFKWEFGRMKL